jgi:ankyrin repeat protein
VVKLLLDHGADARAKNLNQRTPLDETTIHDARAAAALLRAAR